MRQTKWIVLRKGQVYDEVFFTPDCSKEYVRESLINHDGYPSDIVVVRC